MGEPAASAEILKWLNDLAVRASEGKDVDHPANLVQLEILNGIYRQLEIIAGIMETKAALEDATASHLR